MLKIMWYNICWRFQVQETYFIIIMILKTWMFNSESDFKDDFNVKFKMSKINWKMFIIFSNILKDCLKVEYLWKNRRQNNWTKTLQHLLDNFFYSAFSIKFKKKCVFVPLWCLSVRLFLLPYEFFFSLFLKLSIVFCVPILYVTCF